jgi:hypothetical protein
MRRGGHDAENLDIRLNLLSAIALTDIHAVQDWWHCLDDAIKATTILGPLTPLHMA